MGRRGAGRRAARREAGEGAEGGRAAGGESLPRAPARRPAPGAPPPRPSLPRGPNCAQWLAGSYLFCVQPGAARGDSWPQLGALASAPGSGRPPGLLGDPRKPISSWSCSLSKGQAGRGVGVGGSLVRTRPAPERDRGALEGLSGGAAPCRLGSGRPGPPPRLKGGTKWGSFTALRSPGLGRLSKSSVLILETDGRGAAPCLLEHVSEGTIRGTGVLNLPRLSPPLSGGYRALTSSTGRVPCVSGLCVPEQVTQQLWAFFLLNK